MKKQRLVLFTALFCVVLSACGHTHDWQAANCVSPAICEGCGQTDGEALGHTLGMWTVSSDATCTQTGAETAMCTVCGEVMEREIPVTEHTVGDWEILSQPTLDQNGIRVKNCSVCEAEVEREEFSLSEEEIETLYKADCKTIPYDSLSRTPGDYEGDRVKFSGYVVQICSEAESILYYSTYRVATSGKYDNVVYIKVDNYGSGTRILEDDYVTFYGEFDGLFTYETVLGSSITIPCVIVEYID